MLKAHERRQEQGIILLGLLVLIVLVVMVGGFLYVMKAEDKKPAATTAAEVVEAGGSAISRNAQNVQRKNDASVLLAATAAYANGNQGKLPTKVSSSMLKGMGHYSSAAIAKGEQDPISSDQLRLVTGARCLSTGGTASGNSRQYAAQYGLENSDHTFTATCVNG